MRNLTRSPLLLPVVFFVGVIFIWRAPAPQRPGVQGRGPVLDRCFFYGNFGNLL